MSAAWASFHAEWSAVVRAWCRKDPRLRGDPLANGWDILVDVFDACYLQGGGAVTEQALRRATNRLSTERRRQTRHEITSAPIEAFPERRPRAALTADEWKRLEQYLKQLLGTLPPNQRIALEGRYLEQRSDREIATEIGCAVASVRVVRHRALDELRRLVLKSPPRRLDVTPVNCTASIGGGHSSSGGASARNVHGCPTSLRLTLLTSRRNAPIYGERGAAAPDLLPSRRCIWESR